MESIDSVYTSSQEEQSPEEQPIVQLATIAGIVDDGLTLLLDGSEEPSEKRYKCNAAIDFAAGQRVAVLELSGSKVVMFPVGLPGTLAPHGVPPGGTQGQFLKKSANDDYKLAWGSINGTLPSGGTDGQVLLKSGATNYSAKWGAVPAPTVAALTSGAYKLILSSRTLTPSATGFVIGTSSYPVGLHSESVRLYYSAYRYCTLTCTSAGKLAVDGTAIN